MESLRQEFPIQQQLLKSPQDTVAPRPAIVCGMELLRSHQVSRNLIMGSAFDDESVDSFCADSVLLTNKHRMHDATAVKTSQRVPVVNSEAQAGKKCVQSEEYLEDESDVSSSTLGDDFCNDSFVRMKPSLKSSEDNASLCTGIPNLSMHSCLGGIGRAA